MGGVDLADQMRRFYPCTHKSSRRFYLCLFWILVDLAIDNAYILECCMREKTGLSRRTNLISHKKLATELLSMHSLQSHYGRQVQNVPARLVQRHFPAKLGSDSQCVSTRKRNRFDCKDCGNVHLCVDPCFRLYHTRL